MWGQDKETAPKQECRGGSRSRYIMINYDWAEPLNVRKEIATLTLHDV